MAWNLTINSIITYTGKLVLVTSARPRSYGRVTGDLRASYELYKRIEPYGLHGALRAARSLTGRTEPYGLHRALRAAQSLTGCTEPYGLHRALWARL
jgi:hypothetical protein